MRRADRERRARSLRRLCLVVGPPAAKVLLFTATLGIAYQIDGLFLVPSVEPEQRIGRAMLFAFLLLVMLVLAYHEGNYGQLD
jgi:hypothetical protein